MAHHKDLTGTDLHEPKGVASASSGQVYVANGSGSGAWSALPVSYYTVSRTITNVSSASTFYVGIPVAGTIVKCTGVLDASLSAGSDATVSFKIGGVSVDTSNLDVVAASTAGSVFTSTPSGHNTVAVGNQLAIATDGLSTGSAALHVTVLIRVT